MVKKKTAHAAQQATNGEAGSKEHTHKDSKSQTTSSTPTEASTATSSPQSKPTAAATQSKSRSRSVSPAKSTTTPNKSQADDDRVKAFRSGLSDLTPNNLGQLKLLTSVLFPGVEYAESFFKDALESGEWAKLVLFSDVCVGSVVCRKEPHPSQPDRFRVYIMTLGVLKPYRKLGLGSKLLDHILSQCSSEQQHHHSKHSKDDKKPASATGAGASSIVDVYLHVQTSNEEALRFYQKRGFTIQETVRDYYTEHPKLEPPLDAHVLVKTL
ncbi:N-alpha-acetyltransferase 50 [Quaeritorhiza haematococci]|nr:N-alpha-acetyltransferase 50 [Quaeritorhiza haematococci]